MKRYDVDKVMGIINTFKRDIKEVRLTKSNFVILKDGLTMYTSEMLQGRFEEIPSITVEFDDGKLQNYACYIDEHEKERFNSIRFQEEQRKH